MTIRVREKRANELAIYALAELGDKLAGELAVPWNNIGHQNLKALAPSARASDGNERPSGGVAYVVTGVSGDDPNQLVDIHFGAYRPQCVEGCPPSKRIRIADEFTQPGGGRGQFPLLNDLGSGPNHVARRVIQ